MTPHQELGEESQIEANEHEQTGDLPKGVIVHFSKHFRPPVVQSSQECNHGSAKHDIVKMGHHEVGVMQVNISCQRTEKETSQSPDTKQKEKGKGLPPRGLQADRSLVERGGPIEDLDG